MTGDQFSVSLATVGRQLSSWFGDHFHRVSLKKLHYVICALLAVWVLYSLVRLVVTFFPSYSFPDPALATDTAGTVDSPSRAAVDLAGLQAMNWFGVAGEASAQTVKPVIEEEAINAAKTALNLSLEGIVYSPDTQESVAVIVHQGKQEQYRVGDKMPAGNSVSLAKVMLDHVILDNGGTYESLWLYDDSKPSTPDTSNRQPTVARDNARNNRLADMRGNETVTEMASDYQERLYKNPASLAEVVRITPEQRDGQMVGYRISPGKDRAQFEKLGLQANDIVTSINGIELNEPSNALEIYKLMRTATQASFILDRGGETVEIMVSLQSE